MRAMLVAFVLIFVIAIAANLALENAGFSSRQMLSSDSVRF